MTASFPILLVDEAGVVTRANPAAHRLFGSCVGQRCSSVVRACGANGVVHCNERCAREIARGDTQQELTGTVRARPSRVVCASLGRGAAVMVHPDRGDAPLRAELTPREIEVVRSVSQGRTMKLAAAELGIGVATVRTHLDNAREKLGVTTLPELVAAAIRLGLR